MAKMEWKCFVGWFWTCHKGIESRSTELFYVMRSCVMFDWGLRVSWEVRDDGKGEVSSAVLQVLSGVPRYCCKLYCVFL
jgi:hypothetical protein